MGYRLSSVILQSREIIHASFFYKFLGDIGLLMYEFRRNYFYAV